MLRVVLAAVAALLALLAPYALSAGPAGSTVVEVPASKLAPLLVEALRTPDGGFVVKCGPVYAYFNWTGGDRVRVLLYWFTQSLSAEKAVKLFNVCLAAAPLAEHGMAVRSIAPMPLAAKWHAKSTPTRTDNATITITTTATATTTVTVKAVPTATPIPEVSKATTMRPSTSTWQPTSAAKAFTTTTPIQRVGGAPDVAARAVLVALPSLAAALLTWLVLRRLL